ncbi:MAG: DEAD/DEAH box helicase [Cyanobacteria bacterium M_DeepCast_200m_mx_001]|nr:DEAD/DEAH box helicase [Cyanobacteria bacterium M_DeepCast_200m_mx_001]
MSSSPFAALGLGRPIVQAVLDKGYTAPSPIQQQCIPAVLAGRDVMAAAQTGTGKTAGFTLPMLERLRHGPHARNNIVRALVLTPTRELAAQVGENVAAYSRHLDLRSDVVFGGVKINPQMMRLRRGADVLVATPGRLMDLAQQNAVKLDRVEILVLDEADRMLDMGFIRDIQKILALLPARRQNLLFSATFEASIKKLATGLLHNPVQLQATPENRTATTVEHVLHPCDMARKPELLCHLIRSNDWQQVLVFSRTKHGANRIAERLSQEGMEAAAIHGNKSQGARTRALSGFKAGEVRVLVATDIAARGIDIHQLPHVVNLDLPNQAEDYVHRIGRTGRAGHNGHAVSLVAAEEHELLRAIERLIGNPLPRQEIPGFEPTVLSAPPLDLSGGRGRGGGGGGGGRSGRGGSDRGGAGARRGGAPSGRASAGRPAARSSSSPSARPRSGR